MKDFNLAKYLKEHNLGSHGILGKYVDLQSLKEESEEQLDTEVPYKGPDPKLDGFGDKFDQVDPVSEADGPWGKPDTDEENPWMENVDGTDAYKAGNWTCYYDFPGILVWSYGNVPLSKLAVYATPNWDNTGETPIQIDIDEETQDNMTLKQGTFANFDEYAKAMMPFLNRIESLEKEWGALAPGNEELGEEVDKFNQMADTHDQMSQEYVAWLNKNGLPQMSADELLYDDSIEKTDDQKKYLQQFIDKWDMVADFEDEDEPMNELEKPTNIYADDEDFETPTDTRIMDLGGSQIEQGIIALLDDGFEAEDIIEFCQMIVNDHANTIAQGKKF